MRREDFEHVIAAAAEVSGEDEFVVVGSQAILGTYPKAPETMLRSMEADIYPRRSPGKANEIDGSLGDGSPFQRAYGYYAHGVGPETAKPPVGWEKRLVAVQVGSRVASKRTPVAYCLEVHDLVLAKCVAGRDRDWDFAREALRAGFVSSEELRRRSDGLPVAHERRAEIRTRLETIVAKLDDE
jgi:hypothetical protein